MLLFKNKYRIETTRLQHWDYSLGGAYFVTIVTRNRECLFGDIINGEMVLNEFGEIVEFTWYDLPNHNSNIGLDVFRIVPNHIHGIIFIVNDNNNDNNNNVETGSEPVSTEPVSTEPVSTNTNMEINKKTSHGLPEIVRQFKTFSAMRINQVRNTPSVSVWQSRYYDHIIRNEQSLNNIRQYIIDNPLKWEFDKENPNKYEQRNFK